MQIPLAHPIPDYVFSVVKLVGGEVGAVIEYTDVLVGAGSKAQPVHDRRVHDVEAIVVFVEDGVRVGKLEDVSAILLCHTSLASLRGVGVPVR